MYTRHTTKTTIHSYACRHTTTSPKTRSKHTNTAPWAIGSVPHRPHPATVLVDFVFARDSLNPPVPQRPSTHRPGGPGGRKSAFTATIRQTQEHTHTHRRTHLTRRGRAAPGLSQGRSRRHPRRWRYSARRRDPASARGHRVRFGDDGRHD